MAIPCDQVTNRYKVAHLLGIDVDHLVGLCPLVTAYRLMGLQVLESDEAQSLEHLAHSAEGFGQNPGNATEGAALMVEANSALQFQSIERPPLGAANTVPIHQSSGSA